MVLAAHNDHCITVMFHTSCCPIHFDSESALAWSPEDGQKPPKQRPALIELSVRACSSRTIKGYRVNGVTDHFQASLYLSPRAWPFIHGKG